MAKLKDTALVLVNPASNITHVIYGKEYPVTLCGIRVPTHWNHAYVAPELVDCLGCRAAYTRQQEMDV